MKKLTMPATRTIPSKLARQRFGELIELARLRGERIYITKRGKPAACLIGPGDAYKLIGGEADGGTEKKPTTLPFKTYQLGIKRMITRKDIYGSISL